MSKLPNPSSLLPSGSRRRLGLSLLMLALLVGCGAAAGKYLGQNRPAPAATVTVKLGDVENTVTSLGKLKPKDYVDVGTQVSGQLKKVAVQIGDRVQKGDLIAEVDATVYETRIRTDRSNLDSLQAQLTQQKAELDLAERQAARNRQLFNEKAASQESLETSEAAFQVAGARVAATQAQIKAAQAALDGDLANLGYTKIYAPMAGTVVSQTSLQGQTVNANQSAPVIVQIADLDTMTVWAQVAEADVSKIQPGMPAYFSTLGDAGTRWQGTVRQVLPTPETVNDVVLYNVLVDVDNSELKLMSQMTVQVFFVLDQARGVPVVPLSALRQERDGWSARVAAGDGVQRRSVQLGVTSRTEAQVVAGLAAGDKLLLPQPQPSSTPAPAPARGGRRMGARL